MVSIHVLCVRELGCQGKWVAFPDRTSRAGSVGGRGLQRLGRVVTSRLSELPGGHRSGLVGLGWDGGEYTCIMCERVGLSGQVGCVPRPYLTCWKCGRSWSSEIGSRSHTATVRTLRRTPVWSGLVWSGLVGLGWDGGEYTCIMCERVGLSGQAGCVPRPYLTCWKCGRSWSSEIGSRSHTATVRTLRRTPVWSGGVGVGRW